MYCNMITCGDIDVQSGVNVLQHDLLQKLRLPLLPATQLVFVLLREDLPSRLQDGGKGIGGNLMERGRKGRKGERHALAKAHTH